MKGLPTPCTKIVYGCQRSDSKRPSINRQARRLHDLQFLGDSDDCFTAESGMMVPIGIRGKIYWINCSVTVLPPTIHLVLGMDYFMKRQFQFTFEGITLNSHRNWANRHHEETNYVYNHQRRQELKNWLRRRGYKLEHFSRKKTFNRHRQYFSNNKQIQDPYY